MKIQRNLFNRKRSSTKLTLIQASSQKDKDYFYSKKLDKRRKRKPKYELRDLVRTAEKRNFFLKVFLQLGAISCIL